MMYSLSEIGQCANTKVKLQSVLCKTFTYSQTWINKTSIIECLHVHIDTYGLYDLLGLTMPLENAGKIII